MRKQKIKKTPITHSPIACKKCGSIEFERTVQQVPSIVKIFLVGGTIDDEVIREGDQEFTYHCAKCATIFDGEDVGK